MSDEVQQTGEEREVGRSYIPDQGLNENERIASKTGFSSGDLAKRIEKIRMKRTPKSSFAKEFSRMPQNKSDAENGHEIGKHTWKGFVQGLMSSRKDEENARDARLAAELE